MDACAVATSVTTAVLVAVANDEGDIERSSTPEAMVFRTKMECYAGDRVLSDWSKVRENHNKKTDSEKDGESTM